MVLSNPTFPTEADKICFVQECERQFEEQLQRVCDTIVRQSDLRMVTLAGPTCSGKTTTAKKLIQDIERTGRRVKAISIDDFFRNQEALNTENGKLDYDTVAALDFICLLDCMEKIFANVPVLLPTYDFVLGKRGDYTLFQPIDYDLILFEGIQAIYPEFTRLFQNHPYKSIYINVADSLTIYNEYFSARTIRFIRRLVRDYKFRNSSPAFTFFLWESVAANEDKNILPYEKNMDIKLNSLLPYELFLIKKTVIEILEKMPQDSPYYKDSILLQQKFDHIPEIKETYLPKNSVYREFLG